ncbi:GMC family oxidoreductase [Granulicella aggregans]|nr:GMC family oxidoreductase N-terminal domain-containing protein [Granulicella aggregans]
MSERVRRNQSHLRSHLRSHYDFIVCGSGSSGSVVASRLAENPDVHVLLLEAGGSDDVPQVMEANQWPLNLGSERDWGFQSKPSRSLNGRVLHMAMGKVLGGGSSINVMVWARGHKSDWDYFAQEANDPAWSYDSVLKIYRRIEDWQGSPDPEHRGAGGPVFVEPATNPNPIAPAMLDAARSLGIPTFENQNGRMMEGDGGASIIDVRAKAGKRQSIFRSYVYPRMDQENLTVLTGALVLKLNIEAGRATGVDVLLDGVVTTFGSTKEMVLSMGAIQTPKLLMQSGIGDESELRRHGIPVLQHAPGVGQNFQDHVAFDCVWEYLDPLPPKNTMAEATFFWKSDPALPSPDIQACQAEVPKTTPENAARYNVPQHGWTLFGGLMRPKSRGHLSLTGPQATDPVVIEPNFLSHPDDLKAAIACVELCREVGNAAPLRSFSKREVMPGLLKGPGLEDFVRNAATTYWHETCTAKMGTDKMSVVNGRLQVYGIQNLRIADGSIMPRVTTGNTMAPCVIIGERAAKELSKDHGL